ncbi:MAG TPA: class I tRNA ligase family protein [Candidatus Paceibacterota bacterium]|nr:class I tRNA ligase family protein [Candidatus Paceibacterota bacterium]
MTLENKANLPEKLLKPYNPADVEGPIYKTWEESGFFNPDVCIEKGMTQPDAEHFSIILPPPNVTGTLHTGHAFMLVIQDIMVRFARMQGKKTLWIPGTDHAAISTQTVVEKNLEKEKIRKQDLGREEFLNRVNEFAQNSHDTIVGQLRKMGASLDWSREAFTLDDKRTTAVHAAFKKMYDDGLIYRGYRIVNWDPKGQTVISDDETDHEEREAQLYTFKYWKDFPISISTTRPETKVGDTAVAVHPDDTRYKEFVGKTYEGVFCGVPLSIKIVADESVESEFGTGALGVTPAHSQIDWDIAQRHQLEVKPVINEFAKMTVGDEQILGKKTTEAREAVVEYLRTEGLLEKEETVKQNVSIAERSKGIIEPLPKLQWFVDVNKKIAERGNRSLKELMLDTVRKDGVNILPSNFEKVYFHWIEGLRDWCISRQIWYGHRIPVWYDKDGNIHTQKKRNIIFVRHGESEANAAHIYAGKMDTPLTEKGREQAKATADLLKGKNITKIFSSDLSRAHDTAKIIADTIGLEVETSPEFQEIYGGTVEGTPSRKIPIMMAAFDDKTGETQDELIARGKRAWDIVRNDNTDGDILIVGHATFSAVMKAVLEGENDLIAFRKKWRVDNASITKFPIFTDPKGEDLEQDPDTLDTWFSSGLWTFSTLGWPEETSDFKTYHPTSVLETGNDIIFFWVARMILMSTYLLGATPFKTVYLHGMVLDKNGKKMSKSNPATAIDPVETVEKYGADALRMSMIVSVGPGQPTTLSEEKIRAYSKFANKIWNATRFVMEQTHDLDLNSIPVYDTEDQQSIDDLQAFIKEITKEMEEYKFYLVSEKLYHYFWDTFASTIIERSKIKIAQTNSDSAKWVLVTHLQTLLKALHPFMPFITEEIWSIIPHSEKETNDKKLLIIESWPTYQ